MSKVNGAAYLAQERRELSKAQQCAKFFTSEYRKYRTPQPDLARAHKTLAKIELAKVRLLKRHITKAEAIQKRLEQVNLRMAVLEAELKGLSARPTFTKTWKSCLQSRSFEPSHTIAANAPMPTSLSLVGLPLCPATARLAKS